MKILMQKLSKIPKVFLILIIIQLFIPCFFNNPYYLKIFILFYIYTIFAISWDLLGGYAGIVSFGHALFFGVAAYTTALLNINLGFPPYLSFPFSVALAVLAGLLIAVPCMRLKGHYLSLATFAFPTILIDVFHAFPNVFGADVGVAGIDKLSPSIIIDFYILLFVMLVIYYISTKIIDSDIGLILRGIQSNEAAVISCGIDTAKVKLQMFIVSGLFAGIAGFFYAHIIKVVGPGVLSLDLSINAIIMCILGGLGTILGPVIGAFITTFFSEFLRFSAEYRILIFNLLVILVVLFIPKGLINYANSLKK